ncbi:MAG: excinuclease ABC subunit UvrA [Saprospiraceae bacterium]|nr:excinuclease ABC subunit UvrA [Saprospiraceae bacterium]
MENILQSQINISGEEQNKAELRKFIHIKGARSNNLKDIELFIPKNKLVVVTGVSGSGKSSLIIDTLYAEGQRRYVESLSSYARQFLDRMKKPEVDYIKGICPAIAIEQKVSSSNARSTVGSLTEVYDYLRLLYARIGKTISPVSGEIVKKHEVSDVVNFIFALDMDSKVQLLTPLQKRHDRTIGQELDLLLQKGYSRVVYNNNIISIEELLEQNNVNKNESVISTTLDIKVLIDRFVVNDDEDNKKRVADSVLIAFSESEGECIISVIDGKEKYFNNRFELDGIIFLEPTHQLFNYNNPYGACPKCEGYGKMLGIDPDKVIPDDSLSVYQEAVACWRGEKGKLWLNQLIQNADQLNFPIHKPYKDLTNEQKEILWSGNRYFDGIDAFFQELEDGAYKIQNRVMLSRYRGKTVCNVCKGGRLRKEATYVKVNGQDITKLINIPIEELLIFIEALELSAHDQKIAERILTEVKNRLRTMIEIGLGYLSLDRLGSTLSGGETQRINLTRTLGSNLTNSLYILDEPSVGLHPKDTEKLVSVLKRLRNLRNTVVVIEHEEAVIRNADYIVDIGPEAGVHGGALVYDGAYEQFSKGIKGSLASEYIAGTRSIKYPAQKRKIQQKIILTGASQHNLKNIDVTIPLQAMTAVTGVSGSGKTSLVKHILYPALKLLINDPVAMAPGRHKNISGDVRNIKMVEMVSQSPIGKSSRSNPVTYVKAYDDIRKLFSDQQLSKIKGFEPKHFSFNVEGGRCETCKGEGYLTVEMQFLADVTLLCEECGGKRFKKEVLEVTFKDKSIYDVLDMTIEESLTFFKDKKNILARLQPLSDVGLGYIKLGQSSSTLSGGEAQRVKLASFLTKEFLSKNIFFIFDEPTTGLHFHDINKLMDAFNALVENGHTVLIVEHNMEVIRAADWVIDLGPGGGKDGGNLVFEGRPEELKKISSSYTGQYI